MNKPTINITADAKLLVDCECKYDEHIKDEIAWLERFQESFMTLRSSQDAIYFVNTIIEKRLSELKGARE